MPASRICFRSNNLRWHSSCLSVISNLLHATSTVDRKRLDPLGGKTSHESRIWHQTPGLSPQHQDVVFFAASKHPQSLKKVQVGFKNLRNQWHFSDLIDTFALFFGGSSSPCAGVIHRATCHWPSVHGLQKIDGDMPTLWGNAGWPWSVDGLCVVFITSILQLSKSLNYVGMQVGWHHHMKLYKSFLLICHASFHQI